MNILIGRGGNQKQKITDPSVATCHCIIRESDMAGEYEIEPLNVKPTYVDGRRIFDKKLVDGNNVITVGNTIDAKVKDLVAESFDILSIDDWGVATRRFDTALAAEVFHRLCIDEYRNADGNADIAAESSIAACRAYRLIEAGKLRAAQELIYEAGDKLYGALDSSERKNNAYAAILVLLSHLYEKAGRGDVAKVARDGALTMIKGGAKCSPEVMEYLK